MCNGRCPKCGYYSCSCSSYDLRRYQDDHRFDHASDVRRRWAQDDANDRVECELRDRRRREEERQEEEREERRRAAADQAHRERVAEENAREEYEAEMARREAEAEPEPEQPAPPGGGRDVRE